MVIVTLPLYDISSFLIGSRNTAVSYNPNVNDTGMKWMLSICSLLFTLILSFSTFTPGFLTSINDITNASIMASITFPSSEIKNSSLVTLHTYLLLVMHNDYGSSTPDSLIILSRSVLISIDSFLDSSPLIDVSILQVINPSDDRSPLGATISSVVLASTVVFPNLSSTFPREGKNSTWSFLKSKSSLPSGLTLLSKQSWRKASSRFEQIMELKIVVNIISKQPIMGIF